MILNEILQNLSVSVKTGGSIVSHKAQFSTDSKTLFVIQGNAILLYNCKSGFLTGKFVTPSASPIANIAILEDPQNTLLVLTQSGEFLHVAFNLDTPEILFKHQLNLEVQGWTPISSILNFIWPTKDLSPEHFFIVAYIQDDLLPTLYLVTTGKFFLQRICWNLVSNMNSVDCGHNGNFLVALQSETVFVKNFDNMDVAWHASGTRKFTCVAVHPSEWMFLTGDDSGRILLWSNVFGKSQVAKTTFHWHTLPIVALAFSIEGSQLFSGGGECTLLKWDVKNVDNKRTLPRMGLPIRHVSVSPQNNLLAVSHADNCIQLVDTANTIITKIQNMTQCYIPDGLSDSNATETSLGGSNIFQAGMLYNPLNYSIVTNGRPGHLQCYSILQDKHIYELDVTQQNFITAERDKIIPNAEVIKTALSKNGLWLVTGEERRNQDSLTELRLKFWKFDTAKQLYQLNTSIDWPHEDGLKCLKVQPIDEKDLTLIAASSGSDCKLKIWGIVSDTSLHGKSEWWNCENISGYKNLPAGPLSFSSDGTVIAAAFGRVLTLWTSETHELKSSLCHTRLKDEIEKAEFGTHHSSHLVVCCSKKHLIVWDVITSSLLWVVPFRAESLVVDPYSNLVAVFSISRHLYLFRPDRSQPLAVHKNVTGSKVVSSLFVPNPSLQDKFGIKSTLFFINASQELCGLLPSSVETTMDSLSKLSIKGKNLSSGLTPFAQMMADKIVSQESEVLSYGHETFGIPSNEVFRNIMDASPHTMPSVAYFCTQLLNAMNSRRSIKSHEDHLVKVEKAIKSVHTSKKMLKREEKKSPKKGKSFQSKSEMKSKQESSTSSGNNPQYDFDLTVVASDDVSWIKSIYDK